MALTNNISFIKEIEEKLTEILPIRLGVNKKNELVRLVYEISRVQDLSVEDIFSRIDMETLAEEGKNGLFRRVKERLVRMRYPSSKDAKSIHIMPLKVSSSREECSTWESDLSPGNIFIEESVRDLEWTKKFLENFPEAETTFIDDAKRYMDGIRAGSPVELYNSRRENVFLIRHRHAFIKICPCTKDAKRCGYWILNAGFGCPMDCSYCYLQTYSNAPGMVFPANIEDYYGHIKDFDGKTDRKTRIGTGEFTDSLAFDKYTEYSLELIPFFRDMKNLVLELKTKVAGIDNVLRTEPNDNVVISWSVNTRKMAERYEKGASSVDERIEAAVKAAEHGYKIGFHFDPVVYYPGWEEDYKETVDGMFSRDVIKDNTRWVSLGTLRYTPGLKQIAERRFEDNLAFYEGEFFEDSDGKLRYPRALRREMYNKITEWIRSSGTAGWIYLCMEPEDLWRETILSKKDYAFH